MFWPNKRSQHQYNSMIVVITSCNQLIGKNPNSSRALFGIDTVEDPIIGITQFNIGIENQIGYF